MVTRVQIVREAFEWEGTKFAAQQANKDLGCDCRGLISGVPQTLGLYPDFVCPAYTQSPDPKQMLTELLKWLDPTSFVTLRAADVIWFRIKKAPQHLGIVVSLDPLEVLHAVWKPKGQGCVIRQVVDRKLWRKRIIGCFRYRGLED